MSTRQIAKPAAAAVPSGTPAVSMGRKVGRGALFGVFGALVNALFGLVLVLVASHGLGAAGSGVLFACVALYTVLINVLKLGADTGLTRFLSRTGAPVSSAARLRLIKQGLVPSVAISLVAAVVLVALAGPVGRLVLPGSSAGTQRGLMLLLAIFLPMGSATLVLLGAARGLGTVKPFVSVEQVGKPVGRVVLVGLLLLLWKSPTGSVIGWCVPTLGGLIAAGWVVRRAVKVGAGPVTATDNSEDFSARAFWSFAAPRAIASAFEISAIWIGVVFLSAMSTSADAGVYTAVSRFVALGGMVMLAVRLAVASELSQLLSAGRREQAERLHQLCTTWIVASSWPIFLFGAVFAPALLSVFGGGYSTGASAVVVLSLANLVNLGVGNAQTVLLMVGKSSYNMINTGIALVTQLVLDIVLIPHLGALGAAIGVGAATVIDNLLSSYQVSRYVGIRTLSRAYLIMVGSSTLCFLGLALVGRMLLGSGLIAAAGVGVVCSLAYLGCLIGFRRQVNLDGLLRSIKR